jgi:arginase
MSAARVITLVCRTSDRLLDGCRGATTIADLLAEAAGTQPETVGTSSEPRVANWSEDLDGAREALLNTAHCLEDALNEGELPVLLHGECSVALATLPTIARIRPDARILWLDAHGDYNTPDSSESQYLGGMALAGACGEWDPDLALGFADPARVVHAGGRAFDDAERRLIDDSGMSLIEGRDILGDDLEAALGDDPVFVHLDLDVLDKDELPVLFPEPGGLEIAELRQVLARVAQGREVIGFEVTNFQAPIDEFERMLGATAVKRVVEPLLDALTEGTNVRN